MVKTESACTSYEERWVNIFFTDGEVKCKYCPLLEMYSRPMCRRTGEILPSTETTGYWCPLLKKEENGSIVSPESGEVLFP